MQAHIALCRAGGLFHSAQPTMILRVGFFYNVVAVGPGHGIRHRGRLIVPRALLLHDVIKAVFTGTVFYIAMLPHTFF
jgi:hypothetical protein